MVKKKKSDKCERRTKSGVDGGGQIKKEDREKTGEENWRRMRMSSENLRRESDMGDSGREGNAKGAEEGEWRKRGIGQRLYDSEPRKVEQDNKV